MISAAHILLALALPAHAVVYGGNPHLTLQVDWPGETLTDGAVELGAITVYKCLGGKHEWTPGIPIDPVQGWTMSLPSGNYCSVKFEWDTVMELESDDFTVEYSQSSTTISLTGASQSVTLSPWRVTDGVVYGGNPNLTVTIQ